MNPTSISTPARLKLGAIAGGVLLLAAGAFLLDDDNGGNSLNAYRFGDGDIAGASVAKAESLEVDVCSFLTTEDIEAATGIPGMVASDEGEGEYTGARICQYDQGTGELPTVTMFARAADDVPLLLEGQDEATTYLEYARKNFKGQDVPGIGDGAFMAGGFIYVEKGGVTVEISTLVMNGYLPGKLEGEPLIELARRAAENMPAS